MSSIARTQIHRRRCAGNDHYKSLSARLDHSNFFHYYYSQKGMKKGGRRRWKISVICSWCGVTRWICCCCLMNSAGWAFVSNKLQIGFVECALQFSVWAAFRRDYSIFRPRELMCPVVTCFIVVGFRRILHGSGTCIYINLSKRKPRNVALREDAPNTKRSTYKRMR